MINEIKGWHVFSIFALAFGTIIAVNLTLAFNAVKTFPGLEVKNSYVASQSFDVNRTQQEALGWQVSASLQGDELVLSILENGEPIGPDVQKATFGRATTVAQDQIPQFYFDGQNLRAKVDAGKGNWNLRLEAVSQEGVLFQQRIIVKDSR